MNDVEEGKINTGKVFIDRPLFSSLTVSLLAVLYLFIEGYVLSAAASTAVNSSFIYICFRLARILIAVFSYYLFYKTFRPDCKSGFTLENILPGIYMSIPAMAVNIVGLFDAEFSFSFSKLINSISPAVFEEIVWHGIICSNLMRIYRGKSIIRTLVIVSVLFSFSHIINILFGQSASVVILQCFITFGIGAVLSAAYIRTGNLWSVIIIHSLNNIIGNLFSSRILSSVSRYCSDIHMGCITGIVIAVPMFIFAMFLLRPELHSDISDFWTNVMWKLDRNDMEV